MQNRLENAHRKPGLQPLCTVILRRLCLVTERLADTASHCLEQVSLISLGFTATRYRRNGNNTKYCNMCPRRSLHMINNHVRFKIPRLYCSINWISTSRNYPHPRTQLLFVFAFIKLPTRRKSHYCTWRYNVKIDGFSWIGSDKDKYRPSGVVIYIFRLTCVC